MRTIYSVAQIEGALRGAFGVDTQLSRDGTYFAVERGGRLIGCGAELDPSREAAKIRAFFVNPQYARRGVGAAYSIVVSATRWHTLLPASS